MPAAHSATAISRPGLVRAATVGRVARRFEVTFDAIDPHALAGWWAALLGY